MEYSLSNIKYVSQMMAAFLCAFSVVNFACCFYYNPAKAITNPDQYTEHKYKTKNNIFYGLEGYGMTSTDKNGFYNDGKVQPTEAQVLCIGSSQTVGIEVNSNQNYVHRLNKLNFQYMSYNLGVRGQYLRQTLFRIPLILKHFTNCKVIINETPYFPTMTEWNEIICCLKANDAPIENQDWKDSNILFRLYRALPYAGLIHKNITDI